jgi:O-antigen/teichoic acid export membrane protein
VLAAGAIVLLAGLFVFVPPLESVGAALAVAVAFLAVNLVRAALAIRVLGSNPLRPADAVPPLLFLALAALCAALGSLVGGRGLLLLVAECAAYTLLAAAAWAVLLAAPAERAALLGALRRKAARA